MERKQYNLNFLCHSRVLALLLDCNWELVRVKAEPVVQNKSKTGVNVLERRL